MVDWGAGTATLVHGSVGAAGAGAELARAEVWVCNSCLTVSRIKSAKDCGVIPAKGLNTGAAGDNVGLAA